MQERQQTGEGEKMRPRNKPGGDFREEILEHEGKQMKILED